MLVLLDPADIGFVDFDQAGQLRRVVSTGFAQALEHEPRGLLRDADLRMQLQTADALPARDEQIHRVEPFVQWHLRPLEYRGGANREVVQAGVAAVEATLAGADAFGFGAGWAGGAIRPPLRFKESARALRIGKAREQFEGGDCGLAHGSTRHDRAGRAVCVVPTFGESDVRCLARGDPV